MEVWVDGQNNFRVEGAPEDLLAVFRAATDFLRERGRMPIHVALDGKDISPTGMREAFLGTPVSDTGKLEIRSEEIATLIKECLSNLDEAIVELPVACRQLAEIFQGDAPDDGFDPFHRLAEIWGYVKDQQRLVANALELDLNGAEIQGQSVATLSAELNTFLEEAVQALKRTDAIALGDLLEYELAPRAEHEAAIVAWLQERADALPR